VTLAVNVIAVPTGCAPGLSAVTVVTVRGVAAAAKVAVTPWAAVIVTVQLPVPLQAPPQPVKVDPAAGVVARVTEVP